MFPSLLESRPLHHYKQAAKVGGTIERGGRTIELDGHSSRDRTWGYRSESATIPVYIAAQRVFPSFSMSAMCFLVAADKSDRAKGFVLDTAAHRIPRFTDIVRGPAGEVLESCLVQDSGDDLTTGSKNAWARSR